MLFKYKQFRRIILVEHLLKKGLSALFTVFFLYLIHLNILRIKHQIVAGSTNSHNFPIIYKDVFPNVSDHNIFMIDTSPTDTISRRAFCSLESYLVVNSDSKVWFLIMLREVSSHTKHFLVELQEEYPHLLVAFMDMELTLSGTPVAHLLHSQKLKDSYFLNNNLSNLARLAVVYKSGGFYTDSDILALRPVMDLENIVTLESENSINSAAFHFSAKHPFVLQIMEHVSRNFNGVKWGMNGPAAMTATLKKRCPPFIIFGKKNLVYKRKKRGIPQESFELRSCDVTLLHESMFYPVYYNDVYLTFRKLTSKINVNFISRISYGLHLYNSMSKTFTAHKDSLLAHLSISSCPSSYQHFGYIY